MGIIIIKVNSFILVHKPEEVEQDHMHMKSRYVPLYKTTIQ